jgi:phage regulator Rha-like protein
VACRDEARVDSRILAAHLGLKSRHVFEQVNDYRGDFEKLGILRFQTGKIEGRGRPEKFVLLNEDQCYLLLTFSRNTERVRDLKVKLVQTFRRARDGQATDADYIPFYHALHDGVRVLAEQAHASGSATPEQVFHVNFNKLVNRTLGIATGERVRLTPAQRLGASMANAIARQSVEDVLARGGDHHAAYQEAKQRLGAYATTLRQTGLLGVSP